MTVLGHRKMRGGFAAVSAALLVVGLASCSSNGSSTGGTTNGGSQPSSAATDTAAAGSSAAGTAGSGGAASGTPIKIGVMAPTSGNAAAYGQEMVNGWKLYWDQQSNQAAGHPIQTLYVDGGGDVSSVLSGVQRLVQNEHVAMVASVMLANISLALIDPLKQEKVPYVESVAGALATTGKDNSPYFVRIGGPGSSQTTAPLGAWAAQDGGYKKVMTICSDFNFGYEACGGFVNSFTDDGGTVSTQLWAPIGTTDFSSYLTQVRSAKPDAVFASLTGADNARFLKAWAQFGLHGQVPLLTGEAVTDETVLNGMTDAETDGIISSGVWADELGTPAAKAFADAYSQKYGHSPSFYALSMYIAGQGITRALQETNGDTSPDTLMKALRGIKDLPTPIGNISIDQYGSQTQNVVIRKVVAKNGKPVNQVIKTYPNVSQFWNYDPQQFFAHPGYSKTYQGNGVWPNPAK